MGIYLGFGDQDNFKSWLIKKVTQGPYSHVWIEYDSQTWGGRMVVHAQPSGIVVETPETLNKHYNTKALYQFAYNGAAEGLKNSQGCVGKPYDYKVLLSNAVLLILYTLIPNKRFRSWLWTLTLKDSSKYSCTEFAAIVLQKSGYAPAKVLNPEQTSPTQLEEFCSSHNEFIDQQE